MKHILRNRISKLCLRLFVAAFLATVPTFTMAQVKITISDQIVNVKGQKMYAHSVKRGETIYSICKAYGISNEELLKHNPIIADGLKEGQMLYIPFNNGKPTDSDSQSDNNAASLQDLSSKYGSQFITHKVRRLFEDLDHISDKYGVPKEDIMAFNNMKSESLKKIKTLKIPVKKKESPYTIGADTLNQSATDTLYIASDTLSIDGGYDGENDYTIPEIDKTKTRVISLLLPLNSNGKASPNYMDFYSGALMAVEQLKNIGANLKINVFDYGDDISSIAESEKLKESDLIVGPIRYEAMKELIPVANSLRIPIVSPLDAAVDSLLPECPYLFQAALSKRRQTEALADMILSDSRYASNPNIIIVYNTSSKEAGEEAEMLRQILQDKGASITSIGGSSSLSSMRRDMDNIVVVLTDTEGLTAEMLRQIDIKMMPVEKVTVYGTPKWKMFESLDMSLYFKYNTKICMPYNVDLNREDVKGFIRAYRSRYNSEPRANAFSGYDIMYFFGRAAVNGLREYARNPKNGLAVGQMKQSLLQLNMLQQRFRFASGPEGGYVNDAAYKISFNPDFSITTEPY